MKSKLFAKPAALHFPGRRTEAAVLTWVPAAAVRIGVPAALFRDGCFAGGRVTGSARRHRLRNDEHADWELCCLCARLRAAAVRTENADAGRVRSAIGLCRLHWSAKEPRGRFIPPERGSKKGASAQILPRSDAFRPAVCFQCSEA